MATLALVNALNCSYPANNAASRVEYNNTRRELAISFDGATAQSITGALIAASGLTTPLTLTGMVIFPTATSGSAVFEASIMAVSSGDALNLITTESFDTVNVSAAINAPATVGNPISFSITLTNNDAISAGDFVVIRITRKVADASDTIATEAYLLAARLDDARS
jgi:hypothetical protein